MDLPRIRFLSHAQPQEDKPNLAVKFCTNEALIQNDPYCRVKHAAVCRPDGSVIYDLPVRVEPRGAIAVPVNSRCQVALIRQWRSVPAKFPSYSLYFSNDSRDHGFASVEVPRGFPESHESASQTARRETEEELQCVTLSAMPLGWTNCNTSFMISDIPIFAVLVDSETAVGRQMDEGEHVFDASWWDIEALQHMISRGEIRCGITLASLAHVMSSRSLVEQFANQNTVKHDVDSIVGNTRTFVEDIINELWEVGMRLDNLTAEMICYVAPLQTLASVSQKLVKFACCTQPVCTTADRLGVWKLHQPIATNSQEVALLALEAASDQMSRASHTACLTRLTLAIKADVSHQVQHFQRGMCSDVSAEPGNGTQTLCFHLRSGIAEVRWKAG